MAFWESFRRSFVSTVKEDARAFGPYAIPVFLTSITYGILRDLHETDRKMTAIAQKNWEQKEKIRRQREAEYWLSMSTSYEEFMQEAALSKK